MPDPCSDTAAASRNRLSRPAWTRSLRFHLTLWYTGVLALLLTTAGVLFYEGTQQALRAEADGFLASEAHRIVSIDSGSPENGIGPNDLAQDFSGGRSNSKGERAGHAGGSRLLLFDTVYARLVSGSGSPVIQSADLKAHAALTASLDPLLRQPLPAGGRFAFAGPDEEGMMRVLTIPVHVGSDPGLLQVAVPWDHNADILEYLGKLLTLGLLVVLSCAAAGGWALVGRTLRPIGRIVAEADRLDAHALPESLVPRAGESDGEIGLLVATLNGMTMRLRRAFEAQRRYAEAQQRFAADASHELRTPLTVLRGEMDLALGRPREASVYRETLSSAVEEVARMSRIVEGLSYLARQDAGHMEPQRWESVELTPLCRAVVDEARSIAVERRIALSCEGGEPLTMSGDGDQLHQLLRNLVENALKYTPSGGRVQVETRAAANGAAMVIVSDSGLGIAAEDIPHIFERFWRADRSRAGEGSGLGLSICQGIAEAHRATLTAESRLGAGSVFTLLLPSGDR
jgi:signal transduction histidine kinase